MRRALPYLLAFWFFLGVPKVTFADQPASAPIRHFKSGGVMTTANGATYQLTPGYYLPDAKWRELGAEFIRLQQKEIYLTAENEALKGFRVPKGKPLVWLGLGLVLGAGGATYLFVR